MIDKGRKPRVICKREQVLHIEEFDILVTQHSIIATINNNRNQDNIYKSRFHCISRSPGHISHSIYQLASFRNGHSMTLRLYLEKVLNNTQNFEIKEFLILNSKTPPSGLGFPPHPLSYIGKLYTDLNESWTYGLTFHFGSRGMLGTLHILFYLQGNIDRKSVV